MQVRPPVYRRSIRKLGTVHRPTALRRQPVRCCVWSPMVVTMFVFHDVCNFATFLPTLHENDCSKRHGSFRIDGQRRSDRAV